MSAKKTKTRKSGKAKQPKRTGTAPSGGKPVRLLVTTTHLIPVTYVMIKTAPTRAELAEQIWEVVGRRFVDRQTAIDALEDVARTLRLDQQVDDQLGLPPKGEPS
jgi:hypothetical protein